MSDTRNPHDSNAATRHGVIVFIRREDADATRWLMLRRAATLERAPLKIGFPGGEIEPGETHEQAAVREAREEVGVQIRIDRCVWDRDRPPGAAGGVWRLFGYLAEIIDGEPAANPDEVDEILWLTATECVDDPDALPACGEIFEILRGVEEESPQRARRKHV